MKIPSYHFRRSGADCVSTFGSRYRGGSFITKRRAAIAATVCLGWLPVVCAAQEIVPEPDASSALRSVHWSPEGKQLLVVTLTILVGW